MAATFTVTYCNGALNLQIVFLHAYKIIAAHITSMNNKFIDNLNFYQTTKLFIVNIKSQSLLQPLKHRNFLKNNSTIKGIPNCFSKAQDIYTSKETNINHTLSSNASTAAYNNIGQNINLLKSSMSFYAASSVILALCYLTTTTSAATATSDPGIIFDKHPIFDESSSDKEILDLLLEKKRYDKRLLPPVNDEDFCCGLSSPDMAQNYNSRRPHNRGTLTVNVNVLLLSLASPDESSLKYEVEFLLNQQWNDPRLQYGNKSHYDFLNALHHHDSIWTPDTYFIMHGDFKDPIIPMHFALRIYRNGTITYAMRRHLILSCQGSLHIFPFDDPKCSFSMESISYEEAQIKYVWKNDEDTLRKSPSLTTLNAYLIKNQTTACDQNSWRGNYSCLQVELTFTRDRAYYFTTVFIPGIILVTSSFITFWLEWNAVPARVMIGVTTMLNFFTTSNGFRSTLPVVSNLTAMNVWDGVCMCFIYASLLEFVCVNYMGRKRPQANVAYRPGENPVTQRLPAVLSRIGVILASPLAAVGFYSNSVPASEKQSPAISSDTTCNIRWDQSKSGIINTTLNNLSMRSLKSKIDDKILSHATDQKISSDTSMTTQEKGAQVLMTPQPTYSDPISSLTTVTVEEEKVLLDRYVRRSNAMSTNTPPLITSGGKKEAYCHDINHNEITKITDNATLSEFNLPRKPPRKKTSRSTSPEGIYRLPEAANDEPNGEKKRDVSGPNEIVACTTCGGRGSPCTHSINNGCATETCFVQMRKKEPPHPIRVAKTIDVIARITFPTAYAIFLIFFFVHYKGFS